MAEHVLGITGNICGGKSAISKCLRENGYTVFDADSIAKELLYGKYLTRAQAIIGEGIVREDGTVNIPLIRERVFSNKHIKEDLDMFTRTVIFPEIIKKAKEVPDEVCFVEAALIFELMGEKGWRNHFSGVIAICCTKEVAIARMKIRNPDVSDVIAVKILDSQLPSKTKLRWADFSLDTSEMSLDEYQPWVDEHWPKRTLPHTA
jgi:dephospho-CoA kinase